MVNVSAVMYSFINGTDGRIQMNPTLLDQRVTRVEQELRAVQRRVFPGGNAQFEPQLRDAGVWLHERAIAHERMAVTPAHQRTLCLLPTGEIAGHTL